MKQKRGIRQACDEMRFGFFQLSPDGIRLLHPRIADNKDMNRSMAKSVAGHFGRSTHSEIHFALLFQLLEITIGNLVPGFLVSNNDELPGLAVATRRCPAGAVKDRAHKFLRHFSAFIVAADASALFDQRAKFADIHFTLHSRTQEAGLNSRLFQALTQAQVNASDAFDLPLGGEALVKAFGAKLPGQVCPWPHSADERARVTALLPGLDKFTVSHQIAEYPQ